MAWGGGSGVWVAIGLALAFALGACRSSAPSDDGGAGTADSGPADGGTAESGGSLCTNIGESVACSCTSSGYQMSCDCQGGAGPALTVACDSSGACAVFSTTCVLASYVPCDQPDGGTTLAAYCRAFCSGPARDDGACDPWIADASVGDGGA